MEVTPGGPREKLAGETVKVGIPPQLETKILLPVRSIYRDTFLRYDGSATSAYIGLRFCFSNLSTAENTGAGDHNLREADSPLAGHNFSCKAALLG